MLTGTTHQPPDQPLDDDEEYGKYQGTINRTDIELCQILCDTTGKAVGHGKQLSDIVTVHQEQLILLLE